MTDPATPPVAPRSADSGRPSAGSSRRIVVIGGGIAGLAAAWEATGHDDVEVTVLEASERLGGKIRTSELTLGDGSALLVDEGADAFLARVPDAIELCRELGIDDQLTEPATGRAQVFVHGQLNDLPTGTVLGVPVDVDTVEQTAFLSRDAVDSVREELARRGPGPSGDVSIGGFLTDRYGSEIVDHLVGPLIGGINAGDVAQLSLAAVTPQLAAAAGDGDSLSAALERRRGAVTPGPVFHALRGGMEQLVTSLADALLERGVAVRTDCTVRSLRSDGPDGRFTIAVDGDTLHADAVVVCTPAPAASVLLAEASPSASAELSGIEHSSVVLTTFGFDRAELNSSELSDERSGFLVPRDAGLLLTAASNGSAKWAHWDDGRHVVLRVSCGHALDERPMSMPDDELVSMLLADLRIIAGIDATPTTVRVTRYPDGFAQYTLGHLDRVERLSAALRDDCPGVALAGAGYHGVGIPACIRSGREATRQLLGQLRDVPGQLRDVPGQLRDVPGQS